MKHIITNVATEGKEDYQKFFSGALKKFGVSSPSELSGEKKKDFFNYIDDNYKAKNEEAPDGWEGTVKAMKDNEDIDNPYALAHWMKNKGYKSHKKEFVEYMKLKRHQYSEASNIRDKSDYYSAAMNSLDKYFVNLAAVPAPKKAKKVSKLMTALQKLFFTKDESVNEASIKDSDVILARSMWTEKERDVQKALAKDRKVAKHIGKDDIGVYFDDNELVAGGDSGNTIVVVKDGWTLGDLKKAILKKNPRKWQESIGEARTINVEPNWEGVWRFFKHIEKTSPGQWKKMKGEFRDSWIQLQRMADKKGWVAESVNEALSKQQLKGMIRRAKRAGARGYDIVLSLSRDLSVSADEIVSALEKNRLTGMTESIKEVAMPLGSYLDHAMADVEHLIDVVRSEHAEDAYISPKKSGKLLIAVKKLLKKVK
jgi:hypothetical protein